MSCLLHYRVSISCCRVIVRVFRAFAVLLFSLLWGEEVSGFSNDSPVVLGASLEEISYTPGDARAEKPVLKQKHSPVRHEVFGSFLLVPHRAEYEVVFDDKRSKAPGVKDVTGSGVIEIIKTAEGWSYKQRLSVLITSDDDATTTVEKDVASWESPLESSFHVEDRRDGALEMTFQGRAEYGESVGWQVFFEEPAMDGFITSRNLLFPIGHLEKTLEAIKNGKKVLSDQVVFDASCGVREPVRIDTVIMPTKSKELVIGGKKYPTWKLQQALYDFKSQNPIQDYESNKLEITANGVIVSMETMWGEGIAVTLKLKSLTFYR